MLNKETITRIANDVKYIIKNPLINDNIYYKHSETNILEGYALIIGYNDTPYENGFYLFKFEFPENYPFSPPKVIYLTNDGKMRYNPNLYTNGKVCLSVLNTWKGDGWTSCQKIHSILIILGTVLNNEPIKNEPGINFKQESIDSYNLLLSIKNVEFTICKQLDYLYTMNNNDNIDNIDKINNNNFMYALYLFKNEICSNYRKNYDNIIEKYRNICKKFENLDIMSIYINTYRLSYDIKKKDFLDLEKKLLTKKNNLLKIENLNIK